MVEDHPVAEHHNATVPERVVVVLGVVDGRVQRPTLPVERVASQYAPVEVVGVAEAVVDLVDGPIAGGRRPFCTYDVTGQFSVLWASRIVRCFSPGPATVV